MSEQIFRTTVRVLYGDTDAGGIVYNANYLRYFEIGRTELMREWIVPYSEIEKMGFLLPVTESWIRYKASAVYDDLLTIETTISEISRIKCKFSCKIYKEQPGGAKPKLIVKGYTVHAAINRQGKLTRLPDEIQEQLFQYASDPEKVNETHQ